MQDTGGGTDTIKFGGVADIADLLGGTGYVVSGDGGTIGTWDNTSFTLSGNNNVVVTDQAPAGASTAGSTGTIVGIGDAVTEGSHDGFTVQDTGGGTDTVKFAGVADIVGLLGGTGYVVSGNGGTIGTWDNTAFTLSGNNNVVVTDQAPAGASTAGSSGTVVGIGDAVTEGSHDGFTVQDTGGGTDTIKFGGVADIVGLLGGTGYSVSGDGGTIGTWDNTAFTLSGNNNVVVTDQAPAGASTAGSSGTVVGIGDAVTEGSHDGFTVQDTGGGTDTVKFAGVADIAGLLGGTGYSVSGDGGTIGTWDNTSFTLAGNNNVVVTDQAPAGASTAGSTGTIVGIGDAVTEGSHDGFTVQDTGGGTDTIKFGGVADIVGLLGGAGYVVSGDGGTIGTWDNTAFTLSGNNNVVVTDQAPAGASTAGSSGTVVGIGDAVTEGSHDGFTVQDTGGGTDTVKFAGVADTVGLLGGAGYVVSGNGGTVGTWDNTAFTLSGNNNVVVTDQAPAGASTAGSSGAVVGIGDTVTEGSHDGFTVQDTGGGTDTVKFAGVADTVDLLGGAGYVVSGSGGSITTAANTTLNVAGGNDQITLGGTGDNLALSGGSGNVITATSDTIALGANSSAMIGGSADVITENSGDAVTIAGSSDTLTLGTGETATFSGSNDTIDASGGTLVLENNVTEVIDGSNINITAGTGDTIIIAGENDTVSGSSDIIDLKDNSSVDLIGSTDSITGGTGDTATVVGSSDILTLGTSGSATVTGTSDEVDASGATVTLGSSSSVTVDGSNDTIGGVSGDALAVAGNSDAVTTAGAVTISGSQDSVSDAGSTITVGANSSVTVDGASNTINGATGDTLTIDGNGNETTASYGTITVSGSQDGVNAAYGAVAVANGSAVTVAGTHDTITGGSGDTVTVNGSANSLSVGSNDTVYVDGLKDTVYASNDGIVVDEYSTVGIDGSGNGISTGSFVTLGLIGSGDNVNTEASTIHFYSPNSTDEVTGNNNDLTDSADNIALGGDSNANYGNDGNLVITGSNNDEYGNDDRVTIYGSQDFTYGNDDSVTPYSGSDDPAYGQGDSDPDGTSYKNDGTTDLGDTGTFYNGDYGFAASTPNRLNVVGQYDLGHGYTAAAGAAVGAFSRANAAVAAASLGNGSHTSPFEGAAWDGPAVTWSFAAAGGSSTAPISDAIEPQHQAAVEQALQTWSYATGLTFKQVTDPASADIQIGWGSFDTAESGVVGYTSFRDSLGSLQPGVVVRLEDPAQDPITTGAGGTQSYSGTDVSLYQAALHEIGHAIGLGESSDPASIMFPNLSPTNAGLAPSDLANVAALYSIHDPAAGNVASPGGGGTSAIPQPATDAVQLADMVGVITSAMLFDPNHTALRFITREAGGGTAPNGAIHGSNIVTGSNPDLVPLLPGMFVPSLERITAPGYPAAIGLQHGGAGISFDPAGHGGSGVTSFGYGTGDLASWLPLSRASIT